MKNKSLFSGYPTTWFYTIGATFIYFFTKELFGVSDFQIFHEAMQDVWEHKNLYTILYGDCKCFHYFYSPWFAVSFAPLGILPVQIAGWIWKIINFILILRILKLTHSYFNFSDFSRKEVRFWSLITFFGFFFIFYGNLHNHQMTFLLVWGILESLRLIKVEKTLLAGLLLGLIINYKIIPIIIVPYLLYRGNFKAFTYTIGVFLLFLILPAVFIGWDYNIELLESWWNLINPLNKEHNFDTSEPALSSFTTLIPVYFYENYTWDTRFSWSRHIINLPESTVIIWTQLIRGITVLGTLYFLGKNIFKSEKSDLRIIWQVSYLLLAGVMIFPHQQDYALFFAFPGFLYITYYLVVLKDIDKKRFIPLLVIVLTMSFLYSCKFYLGNFRELFTFLKLNSISATIQLILLFFLTPKKLNKLLEERAKMQK